MTGVEAAREELTPTRLLPQAKPEANSIEAVPMRSVASCRTSARRSATWKAARPTRMAIEWRTSRNLGHRSEAVERRAPARRPPRPSLRLC